MKRIHSVLITLVALQVATVLLLGVMTIFAFQNQEALNQLGNSLAVRHANPPAASEHALDKRLAAVESRLGLRDAGADSVQNAFATEKAAAAELEARLTELRQEPVTSPTNRPSPLGNNAEPPNGPGGSPDESPVTPSPQLLSQPSPSAIANLEPIGTLVTYNEAWGFWTVDAGQFDRLREGQELAVRRKGSSQIIARVRVSSVKESESFVDLVKSSVVDPDLLPALGDELLDPELLK